MNNKQWARVAAWQTLMRPRLEAHAHVLLESFSLVPPLSQADWDVRVAEAQIAVRALAMHAQGEQAHAARLAESIVGIGPNGKPETMTELALRLESAET
jgi:hypothetical protein